MPPKMVPALPVHPCGQGGFGEAEGRGPHRHISSTVGICPNAAPADETALRAYRFENCVPLRAPRRPYFFRSFMRLSRVIRFS